MSLAASAWAKQQRCGNSGMKHILMHLADVVGEKPVTNVSTGRTWPPFHAFVSVARLVEHSEMDRKTVLQALTRLEAAGFIKQAGTDGATNQVKVFRLPVNDSAASNGAENGTVQHADAEAQTSTKNGTGPKNGTGTEFPEERSRFSAVTVPKTGHGTRMNKKEHDIDSSAAKPPAPTKSPSCPIESIVGVFHEVLPELPKVKLLDSKARRKQTSDRWNWVLSSTKPDGSARATNAEEAITWFRDYFTRARSNDFLMGRTERSGAHANWRCDFDFLLTEKGLKQVIEKTEVTS